jgi:hypothetical protein
MRRVTLNSGQPAEATQPGSRQPTPLQMMMAGSAMSVLGLSAFLIGIYGSEAFSLAAPAPALAQATPTTSDSPQLMTAATPEPEIEQQQPTSESANFGDAGLSDDIVPEEKFANSGGRPAKPDSAPVTAPADTFNSGDDPWAALDQGDSGSPAPPDGAAPPDANEGQ